MFFIFLKSLSIEFMLYKWIGRLGSLISIRDNAFCLHALIHIPVGLGLLFLNYLTQLLGFIDINILM